MGVEYEFRAIEMYRRVHPTGLQTAITVNPRYQQYAIGHDLETRSLPGVSVQICQKYTGQGACGPSQLRRSLRWPSIIPWLTIPD